VEPALDDMKRHIELGLEAEALKSAKAWCWDSIG